MTNEKKSEMTKVFKTEILGKEYEVDPNSKWDWHSLTYGWAIGKGLSCEDANDFANHIEYYANLT